MSEVAAGIKGLTAQGLLEGIPDALVVVDQRGIVVLANGEAEKMFGHSREELVGSPVDRLVPDAARSRHAGLRQGYMADPKTRAMGAALDLRARRKDGSEIPVEISLSPLETEGERLVIAAVRDISDRRRMEKERQEGRDRQRELEHLREVDLFKTTFLNTAAHELRTPLLPVKSELFMLKRRLADSKDPAVVASMDVLERNIRRLAGLVEDLLDAARYQAGRISLQVGETDVHTLVREAADSFRQAAQDRHISIVVRAEGNPKARLDAGRIGQVVYNLLSNAVKFTSDGGRIEIDCSTGVAGLTVRFTDSGYGLTAGEISRLFQPFVQLRQAVEPGQRGSGLGLYISRGFVEAHGGKIWAESRGPGQGSTFSFSLPPAAPSPAETAGPATP